MFKTCAKRIKKITGRYPSFLYALTEGDLLNEEPKVAEEIKEIGIIKFPIT